MQATRLADYETRILIDLELGLSLLMPLLFVQFHDISLFHHEVLMSITNPLSRQVSPATRQRVQQLTLQSHVFGCHSYRFLWSE
jgi:hypothetical protein